MVVQNQSELGESSAMPTDTHHTPTIIESSAQPQKTQKPRKPKRKDTQVPQPSGPTKHVADEAVHKELGDSLVRAATTASSLEAECQETMRDTIAQTSVENVSKLSNDSLLARGNTLRSDEDRLKLNELKELYTNLDLEKTKTSQANEIASLKRRVKKLEHKKKSRTHMLKRLYKVGLTARVESSRDEDLGEDASKRGRRINVIDVDKDITLVNNDADNEMFDVDALDGEEVIVAGQNENVIEEIVNAAQVSTAATTVPITTEKITLAQALADLKSTKTKAKGIAFREPGESTTTIFSQQLQDKGLSQDKGKGILVEPDKPLKKKDQLKLDKEIVLKLQAKIDKEERIARAEEEKIDEANIAWDNIQAKVDTDYQLAERLQAEEQEQADKKRNKPPTKTQQKKIMITYLKNMEGWKHKDLKSKDFDSIKELFDKAFIKQRVDEDKDTTKPQSLIEVIPDEKEVEIDVVPLATKVFSQMLKSFTRKDLEDLYKPVKAKYKSTRPVEELDLVLWNDLKTMFEPRVEDEIWKLQQRYKVLSWKLFDSCAVHYLSLQSGMIFMLVKKRYPLAPPTISDMLNKKLHVDYFSKMAYHLFKLLTKQLKNQ
ncbi:hypothetical protein Tco_1493254 [Tanacetum coccineum]